MLFKPRHACTTLTRHTVVVLGFVCLFIGTIIIIRLIVSMVCSSWIVQYYKGVSVFVQKLWRFFFSVLALSVGLSILFCWHYLGHNYYNNYYASVFEG